MTDIFEEASRKKLTFTTPKGVLSTSQLWDLPLLSTTINSLDLNTVAKICNQDVRLQGEENFVRRPSRSLVNRTAELRLEIVKRIISVKLAEEEEKEIARERSARREKLKSALASKEEAALINMSASEIEAELRRL